MQLPKVVKPAKTFADLIAAYKASPSWAGLSPNTQALWSHNLNLINQQWGDLPVAALAPTDVIYLQDLYASQPAKTNNLIRCLRSMLSWSVPRGWRSDNPCREIKLLKGGDGYAPWTWDVIDAAKAELRPDLWWCVALALYTGQRLSDVLAMRWSAISASGHLSVRQSKTGKLLLIPVHRDLRAVLDTIPKRATTILTNGNGVPWGSGFHTTWKKHRPTLVAKRGLVFHGLRKSAVVTLLESGCSDAEVAAITGQSRQMVEHYAKQVNQARLAASAILRWEAMR
jgi:integrase